MPEVPASGSRGKHVVALGGGHGLYASLSALRILTSNITAVVTVADDGGSSGRLREELDILPPGDLRMALSALCDDNEWGLTWRDVLQHRFTTDGPLDGHAMGNLLLAAIWEKIGDPVEGLDLVGRLLNTRGRVVPMAAIPLTIEAEVRVEDRVETVVGQSKIAKIRKAIEHIRILPENPPARPEALRAVDEADWVIFGPGSWYTSVLPHLMVPDLHSSLAATTANRILVINLVGDDETGGMTAADHVESFQEYAPDIGLDVILVDPRSVTNWVSLEKAAKKCGAQIMAKEVRQRTNTAAHDPLSLAQAYQQAFDTI